MQKGKGNKIKLFLMCSIIMFGVFLASNPKCAFAFDEHLVINEIYPSPESDGKEWIELYNQTESDVNLEYYMLKDGATAAKNMSGIIAARGYFICEFTSGWLNNSSEILFLLEKNTNNIIDKVAYGSWDAKVLDNNIDTNPGDNAIAPEPERSISRIPNGYDSDNDKQDFQMTNISLGFENIAVSYVDCIKINEIFPQPVEGSQSEFIELYNACMIDIDISGWQIDDGVGGSYPYEIPESISIPVGAYISFYNKDTKISLNDDGDAARLVDPNGDTKDMAIYEKSDRGKSYAKFGEDYLWSDTITPNAQNIYSKEPADEVETEYLLMNIKDAKAKEIGDTMILSGVVTVLPGILSSQYFYIQDADSGIQVYNFRSIFPSLKIGDFIKVKGVLANSNGEIRLKIVAESDIEIVSSSENPVIKELEINDISEEYSGLLITTTGEVQETSGNIFVITDSNNQIKVLIRESADIKKPKMKKGDKVKATGILSVYKGELRILPINRDGVIILSAGVLPITGCEIGDGFMKYNLSNITDTEIFAEKIAKSLKGGDILLLKGELGSGKTTLTQLVLSKLGIVENVTSPTYVIMKNYLVPTVQNHISEVAHVDAYRLDENSDINEIGLQDYIKRDNTLIIIEWPEKINDFLPADCKIIEVSVKSQNSRLCVTNWEF